MRNVSFSFESPEYYYFGLEGVNYDNKNDDEYVIKDCFTTNDAKYSTLYQNKLNVFFIIGSRSNAWRRNNRGDSQII